MLPLPGGSQDSPTHRDRKKNGSCQELGEINGGGANVGLQDTEFWRSVVQMAEQQWEGTEKQ